ncbi:Yip1 domain-containing protein [Zychaea mexicana]|uniref:Yip1 domain-containing protein n=1 Tax=Zychaea mexicana TaxID=64656 RepID=UPI0022FF05FD|nr:Yip1 domain-containing protein [Zychaea mexicana]KAI9495825.1 Yip1 domain-containing protein [Zychaea mexicana]
MEIEPDIDLTGQSTTQAAPASQQHQQQQPPAYDNNASSSTPTAPIAGTISQSSASVGYNGEDTLDEPVSTTILRELRQVGGKLKQVLNPNGNRHVLRDWDLWGPLVLCLALAIILSTQAPDDQAVPIFTGVFVIVWLGSAVVTLNAKLLGGAVSFFQSVCVLGYCLFPLVLSAVFAIFVKLIWARLPIAIVTFAWSTYASIGFLSESQVHLTDRRVLAVYPLGLFYFVISWLTLIS